jgi:hypothetical protein
MERSIVRGWKAAENGISNVILGSSCRPRRKAAEAVEAEAVSYPAGMRRFSPLHWP